MLITAACQGPVNKRCDRGTKSGDNGRRRRTLFGGGGGGIGHGRRSGEREAIRPPAAPLTPERCDNERTTGGDVNVEHGTTGYHPVRRRFPANDISSSSSASSSTKPVSVHWFSKCWRPKTPSATIVDDHHHQHHQHQHHHHLRAHRHRHHHHTHHLHMWTSSCCWWLLVFYAAVVVVASFARAAHSAKDGKHFSP